MTDTQYSEGLAYLNINSSPLIEFFHPLFMSAYQHIQQVLPSS